MEAIFVRRAGASPETATDVRALNKVNVVLVVIKRTHQHAQEVEIVTQVLDERRSCTAQRPEGREGEQCDCFGCREGMLFGFNHF